MASDVLKKFSESDWVWMPHPAHFICARDCRFHLATHVGNFIVSTVGEYLPDAPVREIIAQCRKKTLEGRGDARLADYMLKIGYEDLGLGRKYETMVFRSVPSTESPCCPFAIAGDSLDFAPYNDAGNAYHGHLSICKKWAGMARATIANAEGVIPAEEEKHPDSIRLRALQRQILKGTIIWDGQGEFPGDIEQRDGIALIKEDLRRAIDRCCLTPQERESIRESLKNNS